MFPKAWLLLTLLSAAVTLVVQGSDDDSKLVCFAELWAGGRSSPADYDLQRDLPQETCDYLVLLFLTLDASNWSLKLQSGYGEVDPETIRDAASAREDSPGMKVLLAVGGWEDGVSKYSDMLSASSNRRAFVQSVITTLDTYDLDGLDLHWIYPGAVWRGGRDGDRENFLQLVKELSIAFKPRNWILTASVPPDIENLRAGYNVPRLNSLLHHMHIKTMDMRGEWTQAASGHSPLYSSDWEKPSLQKLNVNDSVALWLNQGASARKLLVSVPLYGRSFTLRDPSRTEPGAPISGPGKPTRYVYGPGLMAYFEACDDLQNKLLTQDYQKGAETPYAYRDDFWVGFENAQSIQKKIKLVQQRKLGGVAVWALGLDDFMGKCGQSHYLLHKTKAFLRDAVKFPDPRSRAEDD